MFTLSDLDVSFINTMRDAIVHKGTDYLYPRNDRPAALWSCEYVREGEPSCIVGHGIINTPEIPNGIISEGTAAWTILNETDLSNEVSCFANDVQGYQDDQHTWGEAWAMALDSFAEETALDVTPFRL